MIRRPPRSTQSRSSAASDVYKRQSDVCDYSQSSSCRPYFQSVGYCCRGAESHLWIGSRWVRQIDGMDEERYVHLPQRYPQAMQIFLARSLPSPLSRVGGEYLCDARPYVLCSAGKLGHAAGRGHITYYHGLTAPLP